MHFVQSTPVARFIDFSTTRWRLLSLPTYGVYVSEWLVLEDLLELLGNVLRKGKTYLTATSGARRNPAPQLSKIRCI